MLLLEKIKPIFTMFLTAEAGKSLEQILKEEIIINYWVYDKRVKKNTKMQHDFGKDQ